MIVKNEEAHLQRCLDSAAPLVDEMVIVDTGSVDRTEEIAHSFGARIFHLEWPDDFSIARNFSLEQAVGNWILVLDADESVAARDYEAIRAVMDQTDIDGVLSISRSYLASETVARWQPGPGGYDEGKPYPGFVDTGIKRLFRNRP
jgi:glycosyltransferase involved in cell wall biosynthesis